MAETTAVGPVVTLLGDSLSAGYGLAVDQALPVQLERALSDLGVLATIIGAGVDGNTTRDGLARIDTAVPQHTHLCVVALGANDMMQGREPDRIEATLEAIVSRLRARGIGVLLCGLRAPPWLSPYAAAFDAVFPAVARRQRIPLYPFLLDGVALDPRYNLPDRIHPNAKGIALIARQLAPAVRDALSRRDVRNAG